MTKKEIMVRAHELARQMVGDYQARLALGLRQAWREARRSAKSHAERALDLAAALKADRDVIVRIWTVESRSRVYVSRMLSGGRKQEMGYIEIREDGCVTYEAARAGAWIRSFAEIA